MKADFDIIAFLCRTSRQRVGAEGVGLDLLRGSAARWGPARNDDFKMRPIHVIVCDHSEPGTTWAAVRREDAGRDFDVEFWQALGDTKIFAAAWDLVVTAAAMRGN